MSQLEKLLAKIINNPKTVRFEDLNKVLINEGFKVSQPGSGSSHYTYRKAGMRITIPRKRPYVDRVYVVNALALLKGQGENDG